MKKLLVAILVAIGLGVGSYALATFNIDFVTICHATGSQSHPYNRIVTSSNAVSGHFFNNGTPKNGHEDDILLQGVQDCPTPYATPYSTPYQTPYSTPYETPYATPQEYPTPYINPPYTTPEYATPDDYATPYATPDEYTTPYATPNDYTTPYATPAEEYTTPYATPSECEEDCERTHSSGSRLRPRDPVYGTPYQQPQVAGATDTQTLPVTGMPFSTTVIILFALSLAVGTTLVLKRFISK